MILRGTIVFLDSRQADRQRLRLTGERQGALELLMVGDGPDSVLAWVRVGDLAVAVFETWRRRGAQGAAA